ncbi:IclR family transcriptional regulator [Haloferax sp. AB510]|uniref:IclR family transcriptional regulator n=1 Tax=Haloferax sp. AB510 TaxID=2934172 RepID=UPI00209C156A|nr:IclR family transcriptional regulator [Haloferax sp. AB510]MCO8265422.1 IclR family transcriptional regulator [Haloferax sp. AB510]
MAEKKSPRTLSTVTRACEILNAIKELNGAGVTELANYVGLSKSGVYTHLATLHDSELVVKEDEEYNLSAKFYNFGNFVKHQSDFYNIGKPELERLADETGESTHLMVEQFGKGVYYHTSVGKNGIAHEYHRDLLENPDYLHWSAAGKAILAFMPEERAHKIVTEHGMPELTENTITDIDEFFEVATQIREQGYATNDGEQIRGTRSVGTAVTDSNDDVLGAISISAPTSRIDDDAFEKKYPEMIMQTANVIEVALETQKGPVTPVSE